MFRGEYQHTVDEKGRLAIPARFRPPLAEGLVVTRGLDRCLYVWTLEKWQETEEKLAKLDMNLNDARRLVRHYSSSAVDTKLDKLGRIVLPQFLRDYAGLSDEVVVVGALTRVEVWSAAAWEAERSLMDEQSSTFAENLARTGD